MKISRDVQNIWFCKIKQRCLHKIHFFLGFPRVQAHMYPNPLQIHVGKSKIITSYSSFFNIDPSVTTVNMTLYSGIGTLKSSKMVQSMDFEDSIFDM